MKIRVDRNQFADAVGWAGRTLPSRPSTPMLSCLRIEAKEAPKPHLTIASYDYEVSGEVQIPAEVISPGVSLVNGRLLVDIAKVLPAQPVELVSEGTRFSLCSGRSDFGMPSLPVGEYPKLPELPQVSGRVPGSALAAAVSQVAVAASKGCNRGAASLTGVRMEADGERLTLAATDRFRLAVRTLSWAPTSPKLTGAVLVPARTLLDTTKALSAADEVELSLGAVDSGVGLLGIAGQNRQTTTRLLDGAFPNYRSLLPPSPPIVARVETAALAEAVKRVALAAERKALIRMTFADSELTLQAGSGEETTGRDTIECQLSGGPMEPIAFNATYLSEGLATIGRPVTHMAFINPRKPAVLTGAASFDENAADDYLYLLMPMHLLS